MRNNLYKNAAKIYEKSGKKFIETLKYSLCLAIVSYCVIKYCIISKVSTKPHYFLQNVLRTIALDYLISVKILYKKQRTENLMKSMDNQRICRKGETVAKITD